MLSGWSMTKGDEIGQAERVTLPQGFMAELRERDLCAEPGCPAAVLRNRRLAFHFVSLKSDRRAEPAIPQCLRIWLGS
jgi:hypothetical protein